MACVSKFASLTLTVVLCSTRATAFLSGAPGRGLTPGLGNKPQVDVETRPVVEDDADTRCMIQTNAFHVL